MLKTILTVLLLILTMNSIEAKDYSPQECPVIGNINSKIYHVAGGKLYAKMLRENRNGDNRKCFINEQEAQTKGFRRSKV